MLGKAKSFVVQPAASSPDADTLHNFHVYPREELNFEVVFEAVWEFFVREVRPIWFRGHW